MIAHNPWPTARVDLAGAEPGDAAEERIHRLLFVEPLPDSHASPEVMDALLTALRLTRDTFAQRDILRRLAAWAPGERTDVVDALGDFYRASREDAFVASEALGALAMIAERSDVALAELRSQLVRITPATPRYVVVRAAQSVARLELLGRDTDSRARLRAWTDSSDSAVAAEAHYQEGVLSIASGLAADRRSDLHVALDLAHASLLAAERLEENRSDAELLRLLIELILTFSGSNPHHPERTAENTRTRADALMAMANDPARLPWRGYATRAEALVEYRLVRIADAFMRFADAIETSERWIRIDEGLLELAAVFRVLWNTGGLDRSDEVGIAAALRGLEGGVMVPALGAFLARSVRRAQFQRVIEAYEDQHGADGTASVLRAMYAAITAVEPPSLAEMADASELVRVARESPAAAGIFCRVFPDAVDTFQAAGVEVAPSGELRPAPLPIEAPGYYGNDSNVDAAVRSALEAVRVRLGPLYPAAKWNRFVTILPTLVRIGGDLRDMPPPFLLCKDADGSGQSATEANLQEEVYLRLKREHGRAVEYEATRIAAGRVDLKVRYDDFELPIEVKAEHANVSPEHVDRSYMAQADRYATERDRICSLLVLDVRPVNAAAHVKERSRRRRGVAGSAPQKLYDLEEGIWVSGLPPDPQIPGARQNAVVVQLFPGNVPKPSQTTRYSSPRTAN
jgi:hypothetical protein